jgi:hypothetical protein
MTRRKGTTMSVVEDADKLELPYAAGRNFK